MRIASTISAYTPKPKATYRIYLDAAATTRVHSRVIDAVTSTMANEMIGNPHAMQHSYGVAANNLIAIARAQVAHTIDCEPDEIIFTSGATEANNLVIQGLAPHLRSNNKNHIITSAVEHKSILVSLMSLQAQGFNVTVLPVKPCGMIEAKAIEKALTDSTGLVSVQAVNNETGTIQPIAEIAAMLRGRNIIFHTDAAQVLGKKSFSVNRSGVDFASLSAHKMHGPQGIGALFVRKQHKKTLAPILLGGGQETGLRAGTVPTALCVGFGIACTLITDSQHYLQGLRTSFLSQIRHLDPIVHGHSDPDWNVPGILNLRFSGIDSESIVMALPDLAIGTGAACSQTGTALSHVIKAMTGSNTAAQEALRISFDRTTTQNDINEAASQFVDAISSIKRLQGANTQ
jgi:cysteine desulfurase